MIHKNYKQCKAFDYNEILHSHLLLKNTRPINLAITTTTCCSTQPDSNRPLYRSFCKNAQYHSNLGIRRAPMPVESKITAIKLQISKYIHRIADLFLLIRFVGKMDRSLSKTGFLNHDVEGDTAHLQLLVEPQTESD